MSNKELADELNEWFNKNHLDIIQNKNFWNEDLVGKTIKNLLESKKRWKQLPRHRHAKGWQIGQKKHPDDLNF